MADAEARREVGASLMFIGLVLWVADLLVVFYFPASIKIGQRGSFAAIIAIMAVVGAAMMVGGYIRHAGTGSEE